MIFLPVALALVLCIGVHEPRPQRSAVGPMPRAAVLSHGPCAAVSLLLCELLCRPGEANTLTPRALFICLPAFSPLSPPPTNPSHPMSPY